MVRSTTHPISLEDYVKPEKYLTNSIRDIYGKVTTAYYMIPYYNNLLNKFQYIVSPNMKINVSALNQIIKDIIFDTNVNVTNMVKNNFFKSINNYKKPYVTVEFVNDIKGTYNFINLFNRSTNKALLIKNISHKIYQMLMKLNNWSLFEGNSTNLFMKYKIPNKIYYNQITYHRQLTINEENADEYHNVVYLNNANHLNENHGENNIDNFTERHIIDCVEDFECPICLDNLNGMAAENKDCIQLHDTHTICSKCVKEIRRNGNIIKCPICRANINIQTNNVRPNRINNGPHLFGGSNKKKQIKNKK